MPDDCLSIWNTGSVYRAVRATPQEASTGTLDTSQTSTGMNLGLTRTFALTPSGTVVPYIIMQYELPSTSPQLDPDVFKKKFIDDLPPIFRKPDVIVNGTNLYQNNQRLYDCLLSMTCCTPVSTGSISSACVQYFQESDISNDCPALGTTCGSVGSDPTSDACRAYCDPSGGRCGAAWRAFCDSNDRFQGSACLGYYQASYGQDGTLDPEVVSLLRRRCAAYTDADGVVASSLPIQTCGCFLPDEIYSQYFDTLDRSDATGSTPNPQCDFPLCTPRTVLPLTQNVDCTGALHECALAVSSQHGIGDPSEVIGAVGIQAVRACLTDTEPDTTTRPTDDSDTQTDPTDTTDTEESFQNIKNGWNKRGWYRWRRVGMIGLLIIIIVVLWVLNAKTERRIVCRSLRHGRRGRRCQLR